MTAVAGFNGDYRYLAVGVALAGVATTSVPAIGAEYTGTASASASAAVVRSTNDSVEQEFSRLRAKWEAECEFVSSMTARIQHPAYRAIVALGRDAIPLLLREMRDRPDHWSAALIELAQENPVPAELAGQLRKVAAAWVTWGRAKGYSL